MLLFVFFTGNVLASAIKDIPVTTKSSKAKELLIKARDARELGDLLMAQEFCKKAITEDSHFAYAYVELAYSSNSTQAFKASLELADQNNKYCSEAEQLLIKIGLSYFNTNWEDRLSLVNKLVDLNADSPRAWIYLANVYTENNQIEAARKSLEKAISLDESFHYAYQQLGFSYLNWQPNDFDEAIENMNKALELVPMSGRAYINLGDALRGGSKLEMARDKYTKAIELDSVNALAYLKRAHANLFLDDITSAKSDYQKAVQLADDINLVIYSNYAAFTEIYKGNMMTAFDGIPLGKVSSSMTINSTASTLLAYYIAVGEAQGFKSHELRGTTQNDILKEYIARNTYIYPPEPSMRLIGDMIEYCAEKVPSWYPVSIS